MQGDPDVCLVKHTHNCPRTRRVEMRALRNRCLGQGLWSRFRYRGHIFSRLAPNHRTEFDCAEDGSSGPGGLVRCANIVPHSVGLQTGEHFTASVAQVHWIQPGQPIRVDVAFTPTQEGPHIDSVTLIFRDNENNGWFTAKRALKGTVVVNNRRQGPTTPSRPPSPVVNRSPRMRRESVDKGISSPSNSPRMRRESVFGERVMQDRVSNISGSSEASTRWRQVDERARHDGFGANSMSTPTASMSTQQQRPSSFYPSSNRDRYSPATSPAIHPLRTPTPSLPLPLPQNSTGLGRGATDEDAPMGGISTEEKKLISLIEAELSRVQTTLIPSIEAHLTSLRSPSPFPSPGRATSGTTSSPQRRTHMHLDDQLQRSIIYFDGILPEQGWMYARRRRKEAIKEVQAWVEVLEEGWAARRE
ncbi:hypothetical protein BD410DRAFT_392851 [Rickenella mellea]|uniref:BAG domain-containing protein n=1 Tax=Rickenella mellea TaxID=50990 RepID=A0A4Y7PWW1_9AGAM|nr:hypothetical protein BD410DRAFT_392851 [Rickenella mellea]